ncbi:MAG TPA: TrmH family RNA methyltransferase [Gemmatimonadaceae bacterium]|nr:TrmH family RNA methyltransferase [Gemmatimonadaceae bacterium]
MPRTLKVSAANAAFQRIEVLRRNRTKRRHYDEFVIEGVRAINGAIAGGWTIRSFGFARGRSLSRWASSILEQSRAEAHLEIAPELFEQLTEKEEAPELLAVVARRPDSLDRIAPQRGMVVVIADRLASPGNLGTLIRSCDAFGAAGVIVTGHGTDLYDPLTIRASVASFFAVPCIALPSHDEVSRWLDELPRSLGTVTLVGTSAHATTPLRGFAWGENVVLVIGNETSGLSHAYRTMCDAVVGIPMRGTATSLNAAVAASLALYEIDSQRRDRSAG